MQRGNRRVQVRGAFAQREQPNAEPRIVMPELASGCRGASQNSIVLSAPVVPVPRAACDEPRQATPALLSRRKSDYAAKPSL